MNAQVKQDESSIHLKANNYCVLLLFWGYTMSCDLETVILVVTWLPLFYIDRIAIPPDRSLQTPNRLIFQVWLAELHPHYIHSHIIPHLLLDESPTITNLCGLAAMF